MSKQKTTIFKVLKNKIDKNDINQQSVAIFIFFFCHGKPLKARETENFLKKLIEKIASYVL